MSYESSQDSDEQGFFLFMTLIILAVTFFMVGMDRCTREPKSQPNEPENGQHAR